MKEIVSEWKRLHAWLPLSDHRYHVRAGPHHAPCERLRVTFSSGQKPDYNIFMRLGNKMFKFSIVQNGNFIEVPVRPKHTVFWVQAIDSKEVGYLERVK